MGRCPISANLGTTSALPVTREESREVLPSVAREVNSTCTDFPGKCPLAVHQPFPCSQQRSIGPPNPNKAHGPNLACFSRKLLAECNSGRSDSAFLHIVRS